MSEIVFEDGARIEVDLAASGDWASAVVVNFHQDSGLYDIMLLESNSTKTKISAERIRRMEEDPSSPRSPRASEPVQRMDSVDEYPALNVEADDSKDKSRSNTPVKDDVKSRSNTPVEDVVNRSRSNSVEKVDRDDRKRKSRTASTSPERDSRPRDNSDRERTKEPQFEYRPQRSKIPFDITKMSYEQYCAKHYQYHIERYQADRAAGLIPPAPMYYGGMAPPPPAPLPGAAAAPPPYPVAGAAAPSSAAAAAAAAHLMMPPPAAAPLHYHHPPPPAPYPYGQPAYTPVGYPPRGYGGVY